MEFCTEKLQNFISIITLEMDIITLCHRLLYIIILRLKLLLSNIKKLLKINEEYLHIPNEDEY